jgi:hypothetical protein
MNDEPTERSSRHQVQPREAGVAEAKPVRLSPDPAPYHPTPRDEPGPEAYPPAIIHGDFIPIEDIGPETPFPLAHRPEDAQDAQDAQDESGPGTDLPSDLSGEVKL